MNFTSYLRVEVSRLRLTGVVTPPDPHLEDVLQLCPKIAWAARLREFEIVAVGHRRDRLSVRILLGAEGEARLCASAAPAGMKVNAQCRIYAPGRLEPDEADRHHTTFVLLGRGNLPVEIRQLPVPAFVREASLLPALSAPGA